MPGISIIGTGKAARFFARRFFHTGFTVKEIVGRDISRTRELASEVNAEAIPYQSQAPLHGDILLLAVPDHSIAQVAKEQQYYQGTVIHCSGSASINLLDPFPNNGVIWPVYSLQEEAHLRNDIPLITQGTNQVTEVASAISSYIYPLEEAQRIQLHLAATMVNNFTHFMLLQLQHYLEQHNTPISPLQAILDQTVQLIHKNPSQQSLTGPARRNDFNTIQNHLAQLQTEKALLHIYELFTTLIQEDFKIIFRNCTYCMLIPLR